MLADIFIIKKEIFLIYKINKETSIGDLVSIKIRNEDHFGIVYKLLEKKYKPEIKEEKIKDIDKIEIKNFYSEEYILFLNKIKFYNLNRIENLLGLGFYSKFFKGKIKNIEINYNSLKNEIKLNDDQEKIKTEIDKKINEFNVHLIYGITGSGKTSIYISLAIDLLSNLSQSCQVLMLMPEINLCYEIAKTIKEKYNIKGLIWHSKMNTNEKKNIIDKILKKESIFVIGTRSALFLPYTKLKLIIIDEEHDHSYKQSENPIFQTRDMSIILGKILNIPVILGSGTPSVESIINARSKKYILHELKKSFFNIEKPEIDLVKFYPKKDNYLSTEVKEIIATNIKNKELILLFINRRGYSNYIRCSSCNDIPSCINCSKKLSYHKKKNILICHHCFYYTKYSKLCKKCNNESLVPFGVPGVEQIQEELTKSFEGARSIIFSSDEINKSEILENNIKLINDNNIDVIIGTQIISKGYHFSNLNTTIILNFESLDSSVDFRADEKEMQLINQVSGRVGREIKRGRIIIQAVDIENNILKTLINNNIEEFYNLQIKERFIAKLPPFWEQVGIIISAKNEELSLKSSEELKNIFIKEYSGIQNIEIFGSIQSPIFLINRNYRYRILIKIKKEYFLKLNYKIKKIINKYLENQKNINIKIDVNIYNFF